MVTFKGYERMKSRLIKILGETGWHETRRGFVHHKLA